MVKFFVGGTELIALGQGCITFRNKEQPFCPLRSNDGAQSANIIGECVGRSIGHGCSLADLLCNFSRNTCIMCEIPVPYCVAVSRATRLAWTRVHTSPSRSADKPVSPLLGGCVVSMPAAFPLH